MLNLTKIVYFETAHAIHGYEGACKNVHGHSYELQVTVSPREAVHEVIPAPGFILDFKELKKILHTNIVEYFDHRLVLSEAFLLAHPGMREEANVLIWKAEPTAENMLFHIRRVLQEKLPEQVRLVKLKLYETRDSCAEWNEIA